MSQQNMDFEEPGRGYQAQAQYPGSREAGPGVGAGFDDAFSGISGQKIGQYSFSRSPSPGQRLALAIVSLCLLVPIAGITFGITAAIGGVAIVIGLVALGLVCLTIMVVNIVFNVGHK